MPQFLEGLADAFGDEQTARALLETAGLPVEKIPARGSAAAQDWWRLVLKAIDQGATKDGPDAARERLRAAAEQRFPGNPAFHTSHHTTPQATTTPQTPQPRPQPNPWPWIAGALALLLIAFAVWLWQQPPPIYTLSVSAIGHDGQPIQDAEIETKVGGAVFKPRDSGKIQKIEIPSHNVTKGETLTVWAKHPTLGTGEALITLGDERTLNVSIPLEIIAADVRGRVVGADHRAILGARVYVDGYPEGVETGNDGSFKISSHVPRGQHVRLHVEHPDLKPEDQYCIAGQTDVLVILKPKP